MDWLIWMLAGSTLALLCVVWLVVWLLIRSRAGREEAMRGQRAAQLVGGTLRFLQEVRVWMRHTDTGEDRNAVAAGSDSDNIEKALASSTGLKTRKRKKRKKRR